MGGSEFSVGDRVRVVASTGSKCWNGREGVVVPTTDDDGRLFTVRLDDGSFDDYPVDDLSEVEKIDEPLIDGGVILTATGTYVDPLDLDPNLVGIEDVAHALSNQCRFSGHVSTFYSVAEHSVRVAGLLEAMGEPADVCLWGLLHDATEAYLVDLPTPLKLASALGPPYLAAESRAQEAIADAFELPRVMPEAVKRADLVLLATERRDLMPDVGEWAILDGVEPVPTAIVPASPADAKAAFLEAYGDLVAWRCGADRFFEGHRMEPWQAVLVRSLAFNLGRPAEKHETAETKATNPKDAIGADKLPLHLWPASATAYGCLGLLDGMLKYGRSNWRESGVKASIYFDALGRHVGAWFEGEDNAPDSGLPHLAHALACLAIIVDARAAGKLVDDRQYAGDGWRALVEALTPHVARLKAVHAGRDPKHYTIEDAA